MRLKGVAERFATGMQARVQDSNIGDRPGRMPGGGLGRAVSHWRGIVLLSVSVLMRFDPPELVLTLDPGVRVEDADAFVAREACRHLRGIGFVPDGLPIPYAIQWGKSRGNGASAPDPARRVSGLLRVCPTG